MHFTPAMAVPAVYTMPGVGLFEGFSEFTHHRSFLQQYSSAKDRRI
jgi:hypothetical protein